MKAVMRGGVWRRRLQRKMAPRQIAPPLGAPEETEEKRVRQSDCQVVHPGIICLEKNQDSLEWEEL